jgi:hypothetical protein
VLAALGTSEGRLRLLDAAGGRALGELALFPRYNDYDLTQIPIEVRFAPDGGAIALSSTAGGAVLVETPGRRGKLPAELDCRSPFTLEGDALVERRRAPRCRAGGARSPGAP